MPLERIFDIAGSSLTAQTIRLNTTASNLSNVDVVGESNDKTYRARQPVFASVLDRVNDMRQDSLGVGGVKVIDIIESKEPIKREYRPDHPLADKDGYVNLPNVNTIEEMANMISASRSYQNSVQVMQTAKTLMMKTINTMSDSGNG